MKKILLIVLPIVAICALLGGNALLRQRQQKEINDALFQAANTDDAAAVKTLVGQGAQVGGFFHGNEDLAPIHIAAQQGQNVALKALLESGADVNMLSARSGSTPLMLAASHGHAATVKLLLSHGAQIGPKNRMGRTALESAEALTHLASFKRHPDPQVRQTIELLREASPSPAATSQK